MPPPPTVFNPAFPPMRLVRAAAFTLVCVSLTLLAHEIASREPVPGWTAGVGAAIVFGMAATLGGYERSLATILSGLLGGQFGLHVLFAAAQPNVPAHLGHAQPAVSATEAAQSGWGMTLAHVAAALMSAWWLRRGERATWSLARRIAALAAFPLMRILALFGGVRVCGPARVRPYVLAAPPPVYAVLRYAVVLRGPPPSGVPAFGCEPSV
jgi:hypothetical protein